MAWFNYLSKRLEKILHDFFKAFGIRVWNQPCRFLIGGIILSLLCAAGITQIEIESRVFYLWVPQQSEISGEFMTLQSYFGTENQYLALRALPSDDNSENSLLTAQAFNEIWAASLAIYDMNYTDANGQIWTYEDVCARKYESAPDCIDKSYNIFGKYFDNNASNWQNDSRILEVVNSNSNNIPSLSDFSYEDGTSNIIGAGFMHLGYDVDESAEGYEFLLVFQQYWAEHKSDYTNIDIAYITARSVEDEMLALVFGDLPIFLMGLLLMIIYLSVTLGRFSCVGARVWLATSMLLIGIFAMLSSFGICAVMGVKANSFVIFFPFIVFGIICDDIITFSDILETNPLQSSSDTNAQRFGRVLGVAGFNITLTALSSFLAFGIGAAIDVPGVKAVCIYAAVMFLTNYVLQFLIFIPLLVFDEKRIIANRNFCCCCITHKRDRTTDVSSQNEAVTHLKLNSETEIVMPNNGDTVETRQKFEWNVTYLLEHTLVPMFSNAIVRRMCIGISVILSAITIAFIPSISVGLDVRQLVPSDSYTLAYLDTNKNELSGNWKSATRVIIENCDFSDATQRSNVYSMFAELENSSFSESLISHWLTPFQHWINDTHHTSIDAIDSQTFYQYLQSFMNDSNYLQWSDDIHFDNDDNPSLVKLASFEWRILQPDNYFDQWSVRNQLNAILKKYTNGFVFEYSWVFASFVHSILPLSIENMALTAVGVAVVLLFSIDIRITSLIIMTVVFIDINIFGWVLLTNLSFGPLAYVFMVAAVGLVVDYVVHMAHAILRWKPDTDNNFGARLRLAINNVGGSVFKGAFTTLIGAIVLFLSNSFMFRTFAVMLTGIILVALFFAFVFVPSVLGEIFTFTNQRQTGRVAAVDIELSENNHLELSQTNE